MAEYAAFTIGNLVPKNGAQIEEVGSKIDLRYFSFPFVQGSIAINTGFRERNWRARCLICGDTLDTLANARKKIRALVGSEHELSTCGEIFYNVIVVSESIYFGRLKSTATGYIQEVEMDFRQLREL